MELSPFLQQAIEVTSNLKYALLFVGTFFEGPIVMIASGFLLRQGVFEFWPMYFSLMIGDLVADIIWYYIGFFFANGFVRRFGRFFSLTEENFERAKAYLHRYHERILFISKVTMGFGLAIPIIMAAGATRVNLKKFIIINFIGEFIFVAIALVAGYFFGHIYSMIAGGFKVVFLIAALALALLFIYNVSKFMKQKMLKK